MLFFRETSFKIKVGTLILLEVVFDNFAYVIFCIHSDIISKGSLKNQSAFYSDKLDKYLENEGKLIETSLELSTNASNSSVLCQLPSKNSSCIEKNQVLLHKTFSIPPPSSYTFKPFSMPSVFRKKKRKTKNRKTKRKRATSRGRAKSFNNLAVPSSILSKEKYAFPDDEIIKLQSELGGNVWERPRTEQQTQQTIHAPSLSKEKLMDLVLEYCMLRNRKLPTHVTDEHGKPSLATHFISQVICGNGYHLSTPLNSPTLLSCPEHFFVDSTGTHVFCPFNLWREKMKSCAQLYKSKIQKKSHSRKITRSQLFK